MPPCEGLDSLTRRLVSARFLPWLILLVCSINVIFVGGKRRCFGIFVSALHESFNGTSMTELNWIGDSYAALAFVLMPLTTGLILHFGRAYRVAMLLAAILIFISCFSSAAVTSPGWMFLTHTLLHGIGSSLVLGTTALIAGEYFDKKHRFHVLATTLVTGGPLGALIFCPLYSYWVEHLGWRAAFRIVGVLFFIEIFLSVLVFKPRAYDTEDDIDQDRQRVKKKRWAMVSWEHAKANPQVFCWFGHRVMQNVMTYGLMMNLTDFLADQVGSVERGSSLNMCVAAGETVMFLLGAFTGDKCRGYLPFIYMIGSFFLTVMFVIWQFVFDMLTTDKFIAFFVGCGISVGNTFVYATSEEVMLLEGGVAYPSTKMAGAFGMVLAPELSGFLVDQLGYRGFFLSMSLVSSANMALFIGVNWLLLYRAERSQGYTEMEEVTPKEMTEEEKKAEQERLKKEGDKSDVLVEKPCPY